MELTQSQQNNINIPLIQSTIKTHLKLPESTPDLNLSYKPLGGLSNYTFKVQLQEESVQQYPNTPTFVYKKYSNFFQCLINRQKEMYICDHFSQQKIGPQVIYSDQNQRIEIFLDLQTLPVQKMSTNINYMTKIAEILGQFHQQFNYQQSEQKSESNTDQNTVKGDKNQQNLENILMKNIFEKEVREAVYMNIQNTCQLTSEQKVETKKIFENLFSEKFRAILQDIIVQKTSQKIVFAHNDLNSTNFLYDNKILEKSIYLIDFEYSGLNYRAHEFGNFFNELTYDYEIDQSPYFQINMARYPGIDKQQLFFAFYLMTYQPSKYGHSDNFKIRQILADKIQINNDYNEIIQQTYTEILQQIPENFKTVFENDIQELIQETEHGIIFSHIFWLIIATLSLNFTDLHLDLYLYIKIRNEKIQQILRKMQIQQETQQQQ